ncbi:MAG: glutathione S-transferase [Arenicella sp.]|jgi:glutathione S-transferase
MNHIQLFSYPTSPYAQKVGCYLDYKGLEFNLVGVNPMTNDQIKFTRQRQVPVLQIGDQWRKGSSEIGLWLEQLYPEKPILPAAPSERDRILQIDKWISDSLIPSVFRSAVEWQSSVDSITNGWKLSRAVNNATPLPMFVRLIWPFAVKRAPFIVNMVKQLDLTESMDEMLLRLQGEFVEQLQGGVFLGARSEPSMADLSAFPVVVNAYMMGMRAKRFILDRPEINAWAKQVSSYLPENPLLVDDKFLQRRLA